MFRTHGKGMTMALGVIIAIVVLIVVALAVIVIVTGSVGDFGASTGEATEKAGLGIQCQTELTSACVNVESGLVCPDCPNCPTGTTCP